MSERASPWGIQNSVKSPSSGSLGESPGFPSWFPSKHRRMLEGAGTGFSLGCPSTQTLLPHEEPAPAENSCVKTWVSTCLTLGPASSWCVAGWWQLRGEQNLLVATVWGWHKAVVETLLEMEPLTGGGLAEICTRTPLKFSCVFPALDSVRFPWMIQELWDLFPFQKAQWHFLWGSQCLSVKEQFFFTCGTDHFLGSDGLSVISSNL